RVQLIEVTLGQAHRGIAPCFDNCWCSPSRVQRAPLSDCLGLLLHSARSDRSHDRLVVRSSGYAEVRIDALSNIGLHFEGELLNFLQVREHRFCIATEGEDMSTRLPPPYRSQVAVTESMAANRGHE